MNPSGTTGAVLRGLEIVGDLLASEDLTIQGNFDGQITMPDHHLSIDAGSSVKGKVVARTVTIGGTLDGSILAPERIELTPRPSSARTSPPPGSCSPTGRRSRAPSIPSEPRPPWRWRGFGREIARMISRLALTGDQEIRRISFYSDLWIRPFLEKGGAPGRRPFPFPTAGAK